MRPDRHPGWGGPGAVGLIAPTGLQVLRKAQWVQTRQNTKKWFIWPKEKGGTKPDTKGPDSRTESWVFWKLLGGRDGLGRADVPKMGV